MKNFSDINNVELTGKDHLITKMVNSTGLDKEKVTELYENFSMSNNGDLKKINESFSNFLNPTSTTFDFTKFKETIIELSNKIVEPSNDVETRERITNEFFKAVESACGIVIDTPTLIEIICFVLLLNDRNKTFEKIAEKIGFGIEQKQLFENEKISFQKINVDKANTKESNIINAKENKRLFESLREILAKNNKSFGYTYHLDNAYNAIVSYLNTEIEELANFDNIYTVEENFEMELINQILMQNQLNPMYRSADVLKKLIPDIQTLVFDCMLLIHSHLSQKEYTLQFVNHNSYTDYLAATKTLFAGISSSLLTSKIALREDLSTMSPDERNMYNENQSDYGQIFGKFKIDSKKADIWTYPVRINSAVDMLHIMKSCEGEFSLHLRKVINNYFTKTMNLLASTEKIIIEQRKSNKFKSGY